MDSMRALIASSVLPEPNFSKTSFNLLLHKAGGECLVLHLIPTQFRSPRLLLPPLQLSQSLLALLP